MSDVQKWNAGVTTTAGVLLGCVATAAVAATGGEIKASDWLQFSGTIITGIITLGAAIVAWKSIQIQISEQQRSTNIAILEKERQRISEEFQSLIIIRDCFKEIDEIFNSSANGDFWDFRSAVVCVFLGEKYVVTHDYSDILRSRYPKLNERFIERINIEVILIDDPDIYISIGIANNGAEANERSMKNINILRSDIEAQIRECHEITSTFEGYRRTALDDLAKKYGVHSAASPSPSNKGAGAS